MTEGLCMEKRNVWGQVTEKAIFISTSPEEVWAEYACEEFGGYPVYVLISGEQIIRSGCKMYPDYRQSQPVDGDGNVVISEVTEIMLLRCKCIAVDDWKKFEYKDE